MKKLENSNLARKNIIATQAPESYSVQLANFFYNYNVFLIYGNQINKRSIQFF